MVYIFHMTFGSDSPNTVSDIESNSPSFNIFSFITEILLSNGHIPNPFGRRIFPPISKYIFSFMGSDFSFHNCSLRTST
ncbi:MAG: hypothetical protein BWY04_00032 [candidate division CPR1 bacterium ADurb.Bin160]|uniref:Uncharacterized protein n=1 Tax=candidate division CPR1 bacterium ADurb.Bin160 TaxID=1852826 RepID=A0A1V5ZR93_9BACT|nr:MAG: hypothetical protein BWY04_00032 [candidate division CPR1 bacterium ADurb.Bin160]